MRPGRPEKVRLSRRTHGVGLLDTAVDAQEFTTSPHEDSATWSDWENYDSWTTTECSGSGFPTKLWSFTTTSMERTFHFEGAHNHVRITFPLVWIDYWCCSKYINIYVDGLVVQQYYKYSQDYQVFNSETDNPQRGSLPYACRGAGTDYRDDWTWVDLHLFHNSSTLNLKIESSVMSSSYTWAVGNFSLVADTVSTVPVLTSPLGTEATRLVAAAATWW